MLVSDTAQIFLAGMVVESSSGVNFSKMTSHTRLFSSDVHWALRAVLRDDLGPKISSGSKFLPEYYTPVAIISLHISENLLSSGVASSGHFMLKMIPYSCLGPTKSWTNHTSVLITILDYRCCNSLIGITH